MNILLAQQENPSGTETALGWVAILLMVVVALAFLALFIGALVSILRSPLEGGMKLVWIVFAFIAPFLGSLLWFVIGKKSAAKQSAPQQPYGAPYRQNG